MVRCASMGSRRLRVLHVIPYLGSGGAERVVANLMEAANRQEYDLRLCVLGKANGASPRFDFEEEPIFLGYSGSLRQVRESCRCVRQLRVVIREWGADIVHSHLWPAARIAGLAIGQGRTPHLVHVHDTWPWLRDRTIRSCLMRIITRGALIRNQNLTFMPVARYVGRFNIEGLALSERPSITLHNAVDANAFRPAQMDRDHRHEQVCIGFAARFCPEKGHELLLHAMAQLDRRGINFQLRLAGEGGLEERLRALAVEIGVHDRVQFEGLVRDMPAFYRELDIFVLPSRNEGLPMTILEAMAAGLPVVATSVGAVPEVIRNGHNGLLVGVADSMGLAAAIECLVNNISRRRALGQAARETIVRDFTLEAAVQRLERTYQHLARNIDAR